MKINIGVFYIKKPISIHFQKQHDKEGVFKQWIWAECAATKPHLHKKIVLSLVKISTIYKAFLNLLDTFYTTVSVNKPERVFF